MLIIATNGYLKLGTLQLDKGRGRITRTTSSTYIKQVSFKAAIIRITYRLPCNNGCKIVLQPLRLTCREYRAEGI